MNLLAVFLLLLGVRLASVFLVQTYFVPDEYWQCLEVAHKLVFGYGYLTWEWIRGIRSYIYPLLFAGLYKALALFHLDTTTLLVLAPRILQALISTFSDYRFFIWSGKKKWSIFLITISWFWFYTGSRTLSNTLEASLTTIALSYYPWIGEGTGYIWPAAICCFLRPTAVIIWIPLFMYHLGNSKYSPYKLIFTKLVVIGALVGASCVAIDSYIHGKLLITPYEFFKYNVLQGVGSFYGTHPWYWYYSTGLPMILGINFLPFLFGSIDTVRNYDAFPIRRKLLVTLMTSLTVYSFVEHKEIRFILPLLPICLFVCVDVLTRWSYKASRYQIWIVAVILLFGNIVPAYYSGQVHQRGPTDLMPKLQEISKIYKDEGNNRASIFFLMPCHSTPFYSHIHENVTMKFITCEPNFQLQYGERPVDEQFYEAPNIWIKRHIPVHPKTAMPTHLVLFESLSDKISEFLESYSLIHKIAHAEVSVHIVEKMSSNNIYISVF
ncbi:PIGB family protein [Megaselia abdita]